MRALLRTDAPVATPVSPGSRGGRSVAGAALPPPPTAPPRSDTVRRVALSFAVAVMGIIDLLSALLSHPPERLVALERLVPTEVLDSSRTFTLLAGSLLLVTAWGLRRGKRRAFVAALFLCAVSVPVNLLKAFDVEEATVASALMFALGVSSEAFRVRSRELSFGMLRSRALWAVAGLLAYVVVGSWALEVPFGMAHSLAGAIADSISRLFGVGDPSVVPPHLALAQRRLLTWYLGSLPLLSLTFVVTLAFASLRPARHRRRHQAEVARVERLLREHGASSIAWFALDDADFFFSRNERAVIAYRFESDTLLVIGDPVGPAEELRPLLAEFAEFCRRHDWPFAFFQARPELLPVYQSLQWRALHIGEDPVLWTDRFTLEGAALSQVRRAVRKAEVAGLTVVSSPAGEDPFAPGAGPPGFVEHLRAVSDDWLRGRHGGEKGFCMGRFDVHRLREAWVLAAWNPRANRVEAFTTWVPVPARRGWALDLGRRRHDATPGAMELLIVRATQAARERGDAMLSLSLSALAMVPGELPCPLETANGGGGGAERAREFLMQHLARYYDFKGLFRWKRRFDPAFEDRYLVYPSALALPRVALALIRAQSPAGLRSYLPWSRSAPPASGPVAVPEHEPSVAAVDGGRSASSGTPEPA